MNSDNRATRDAKTELSFEALLARNKELEQLLVHSEKLASLGELTAGIAHEIQNPLNFILNFSEVNSELAAEMKQTTDATELADLSARLTENLEKIVHHAKRADGIVKSMLQHSRPSSGIKEPTDLNNLADEFLRLSYHGMRANYPNFAGKYTASLDPSLPPVKVIQQDIGRVFLNLLNNAFYSTYIKKKEGAADYQPMVEIQTLRDNNSAIVRIIDNGKGIPADILSKIYQPFFTTKPTGEGTGLGLSLSFDIITKAHQGEMKVTSKENEGAVFEICLPM